MSLLGGLALLAGVAGAIERDGRRDRRAYPKMNDKEVLEAFDDENARYGIMHNMNDEKIKKIAARCRVRPKKNGILPIRGYQECESYVRKYLNSSKDMNDFRNTWRDYVRKCKNEKIEKNNHRYYGPKYYNVCKKNLHQTNNYENGKELVVEISHWNRLSKKEHLQRMEEIQKRTVFKKVVIEPPILRDNPRECGAHTEVWIVRGESKGNIKNLYYCCCYKLGWNPEGYFTYKDI